MGATPTNEAPRSPEEQKGRISQHHPWFFGLRFGLLMAAWDGYRVPVDFRLILPKGHAKYRSENALFRRIDRRVCSTMLGKAGDRGVGNAAYGSKANMAMVKARDTADTARRWALCFAIARTSKPEVENRIAQKSRDPCAAQVLPRMHPVPEEPLGKAAEQFWTYSTCLCLRHVGDVTVVLSKKGGETQALNIPKILHRQSPHIDTRGKSWASTKNIGRSSSCIGS